MLSLLLILVFFFLQVIKLNYVREQKIVNENDRIQYFGDSFNPFALKSLDLHTHTYVCSSLHALFALTDRRIFFRLASIYTYSSPSHHFMQALVIAYTNFLINKWRNQEMLTPHPHNYRKWGKKINASQLLLNWKNQYHELIYYQ